MCPLVVSAGFAPAGSLANQLGGLASGSWLDVGCGQGLLGPVSVSLTCLAYTSGFQELEERSS